MLEELKRNKTIYIFAAILFIAGICIGRYSKTPIVIKNKVLRESGYKYINPILLFNTDNQQDYNHDLALSNKLNEYVDNNKENEISIYFLSLINGSWASINQNLSFSPASMLKVPTVVDTLKYSEDHPSILSKQLYFDGSFDDNSKEYFKPQKSIQVGNYYTIDDLLTYIIKYSDNNALELLHRNIDSRSLQELYKDLNITIPENTLDFMSARTYSLFLRVLYNGTYLDREKSEKILKLMSDTSFSLGMREIIPQDIQIAEKFGEREIFDTSGNLIKRELHECGIVYKPNDNFILCIMTSGKNFDSLTSNIKDITKIVYDYNQNTD